jgi:hypothetical protein
VGADVGAEDWGADACGLADPQPLAATVTTMIIPARIDPRIRVMAGLCDRRPPDRHGK